MQQHKLIGLIGTFSRKEMTRWRELAHSPYHHKHSDVRRLADYLSDQYPVFSADNCDRTVLFEHLYPAQPPDQNRLAVLFSYAYKLAELFLKLENMTAQPFLPQQWLLRELRDRRQYQPYERSLHLAEQATEATVVRDADYYLVRTQLADEADRYYVQTSQRREDQNLQRKEDHLDHYYLIEKLRNGVELLVRSQILQVDYSARLLEAVLHEVGENQATYTASPAVLVYYRLYLLMRDGLEADYQGARQLFQTHATLFTKDEAATIYNYLQNFCIRRINHNEAAYLRRLFELYKDQLQGDLLFEEGYLVEWNYKNIVTVAIRLGELDWTRSFIESYRDRLHPDSAENAYRFNLAVYYHAAEDYAKVLELLTRVEYVDLRYNLGAKALLLRTYYELDEFEALNALVDSFRQYLKRNRLMADMRRAGYYQLFRLTRRAATIHTQLAYTPTARTRKNLERLRRDIERAEAIFNRAWLEQKVTILEARV